MPIGIGNSGYYGGDPMSSGYGYGIDPANMGQFGASLGQALFGNPAEAARRGLIQSETDRNALANRATQTQQDALGKIGSLFQGAYTVQNPDGTTRPATPDEFRTNMGRTLQGVASAFSNNPQMAALMLRSAGFGTGDETLARMGAGMSGETMGPNFAATTGRADNLIATEAANKLKEASTVAGIGAGATLGAARINNQGAMERLQHGEQFGLDHPAPLQSAPGSTAIFAPGDARAPANADGSRPTGPVAVTAPSRPYSIGQVQAQAVQELLDNTPAGPERTALLNRLAETNANARTDAAGQRQATITPAMDQQIPAEIEAEAATRKINLDDNARAFLKQSIANHYANPGPTQHNYTASTNAAFDELVNSGAHQNGSGWGMVGRLFNPPTTDKSKLPALPGGAAPGQGGGRNMGGLFTQPSMGAQPSPQGPVAAQPAATPTGAAPPEGSIIRQNGKTYQIRNGQPVPFS